MQCVHTTKCALKKTRTEPCSNITQYDHESHRKHDMLMLVVSTQLHILVQTFVALDWNIHSAKVSRIHIIYK